MEKLKRSKVSLNMDMKEIVEVWYDFLIGDGNDSQGDEILDVSLRRR